MRYHHLTLVFALALVMSQSRGQDAPVRAVVSIGTPTASIKKLLSDPDPSEESLRASHMTRVRERDLDLVIADDVWNPISITSGKRFVSILRMLDLSKPLTIRDLPKDTQQAMVDTLNRRMRRIVDGKLFPFDANTPIRLESQVRLRVQFGDEVEYVQTEAVPDTKRKPRSPETISAVAEEKGMGPLRIGNSKPNLIFQFARQLGDREHWSLVSRIYEAVDRRRKQLQNEFDDATDELWKELFSEHGKMDPSKFVRQSAANLPKELRDAVAKYRQRPPDSSPPDISNGKVIAAKKNLVIIFQVEERGFSESDIKLLFEAP